MTLQELIDKATYYIPQGYRAEIEDNKVVIKQGEQTWSESDEEELEIAIDTLKETGQYDSAKWVQSLKQRIGGKL